MATTTKELSVQLEEVTKRLRALESGQNVMTSSPGLPLEKWNDHGFVHRHEIKPLVRALNNGGGSTAELEERVEGLESGYTGLSSSMSSAQASITGLNSAMTQVMNQIAAYPNYPNFASIPSTSMLLCTVGGSTSSPIPDGPVANFRGLWLVGQFGVANQLVQVTIQVLDNFNAAGYIFYRVQSDGTWGIWLSNIKQGRQADYFNWLGQMSGHQFVIIYSYAKILGRRALTSNMYNIVLSWHYMFRITAAMASTCVVGNFYDIFETVPYCKFEDPETLLASVSYNLLNTTERVPHLVIPIGIKYETVAADPEYVKQTFTLKWTQELADMISITNIDAIVFNINSVNSINLIML